MDFFFLLGLGFVSSFVGTLPLSTLNLTILKLGLANRHREALSFTYAATLVEWLQVSLTLFLIHFLSAIPNLKQGFAVVSIPILLFLGYKAYKTRVNTEGGETIQNDGFKQGILLSLANVMVYPFWLLWGHIFIEKGWLPTDTASLTIFCTGVGVGTFAGLLCFVGLGKLFWKRLYHFQFYINKLIALAFFGFAILNMYTVLR
jgi:threonine/homoserine/homoserine lactone efflux protein